MPEYRMSYARALDADANPLAGAKLYAYEAGSTTPKDTYVSYLLSTPNANPVVADAGGLFGAIWQALAGRYKFVLKTSADVTVWTDDFVEDAGPAILTTRGDVLTRGATNYSRLALGAANTVLGSDGTDLVYLTVPLLSSTNTWTAANTFQLTDDTSTAGPVITLSRISTTPAASDGLGAIQVIGRDSGGNNTQYANLLGFIDSPTDGAEYGSWLFSNFVNGASEFSLKVGDGVQVGSTTGGTMGSGTINATEFYKAGVALPIVSAWANVTSTGTIIDSYNVTSVSHPATGQYTVNFTSALANADYAVVGTGQNVAGSADVIFSLRSADTKTTGACGVRLTRLDAAVDANFCCVFFAG